MSLDRRNSERFIRLISVTQLRCSEVWMGLKSWLLYLPFLPSSLLYIKTIHKNPDYKGLSGWAKRHNKSGKIFGYPKRYPKNYIRTIHLRNSETFRISNMQTKLHGKIWNPKQLLDMYFGYLWKAFRICYDASPLFCIIFCVVSICRYWAPYPQRDLKSCLAFDKIDTYFWKNKWFNPEILSRYK